MVSGAGALPHAARIGVVTLQGIEERGSNSSPHYAAGQAMGRAVGRTRWLRAIFEVLARTLRSVGRAVRALFLETMGLFFCLFALIGGVAAYREYRAFSAGQAGMERPAVAIAFTLVFGYFAVTSFLRARR